MKYLFTPKTCTWLLASIFAACAPEPKVTKQENGEPPVLPNFAPYSSVLSLTANDLGAKEEFEGSFIFYNPDVTVKGMESAIAMSTSIKQAKFKIAMTYAQSKPLYDKNSQTIDQLTRFSLSSEQSTSARLAVNEWLNTHIFTEPTNNNSATIAAFCDRTLWLSALSYLTRAKTFTSAPLVAHQCAAHFAERGYLDGAVDPNCAKNPAGRNYLKCLWGPTGVQKTTDFQPDLTGDDPDLEPVTWAELFAAAEMGQNSFFSNLRDSGIFERPAATEFGLPDSLYLFDSGIASFSEHTTNSAELAALFGEGDGSWSVFEHLFVFPEAIDQESPERKGGLPKLFEIVRAAGILGNDITADDINVPADAQKTVADLRTHNQALSTNFAHENGVEGDYIKARLAAGHELYKKKIASTALSGSFLRMTPHESYIEFKLGFVKNAADIKACISRTTQKPTPCPGATPPAEGSNPFEFDWNPKTGMTHFKIIMNDLEQLQLGKRLPFSDDPSDNSYQLIEPEEMTGLTLDLELYPRRIKNILDQINGTVRILNPDQTTKYEGAMTLFRFRKAL